MPGWHSKRLDERRSNDRRSGTGRTYLEGSHRMSTWDDRTLIEDLVARCVDDWVHDAEVWGEIARRAGLSAEDRLPIAIGVITVALLRGLVIAGDVMGGFQPWDLSPSESAAAIADRWLPLEDPAVLPGDICWLCNTSAGEELGRAVLAREAGE
jgi:hypothetical protein